MAPCYGPRQSAAPPGLDGVCCLARGHLPGHNFSRPAGMAASVEYKAEWRHIDAATGVRASAQAFLRHNLLLTCPNVMNDACGNQVNNFKAQIKMNSTTSFGMAGQKQQAWKQSSGCVSEFCGGRTSVQQAQGSARSSTAPHRCGSAEAAAAELQQPPQTAWGIPESQYKCN